MIQIEKLDRNQIIKKYEISKHELQCALRQWPDMGERIKLKNLGVHKKVYSQAEVQKILHAVDMHRKKEQKLKLVDLSFIVKKPICEAQPKKVTQAYFDAAYELLSKKAAKRYQSRIDAHFNAKVRNNGTI